MPPWGTPTHPPPPAPTAQPAGYDPYSAASYYGTGYDYYSSAAAYGTAAGAAAKAAADSVPLPPPPAKALAALAAAEAAKAAQGEEGDAEKKKEEVRRQRLPAACYLAQALRFCLQRVSRFPRPSLCSLPPSNRVAPMHLPCRSGAMRSWCPC